MGQIVATLRCFILETLGGSDMERLEDDLLVRIFETTVDSGRVLFDSCRSFRTSLYSSRLLCEAIITQLADQSKLTLPLLVRLIANRTAASGVSSAEKTVLESLDIDDLDFQLGAAIAPLSLSALRLQQPCGQHELCESIDCSRLKHLELSSSSLPWEFATVMLPQCTQLLVLKLDYSDVCDDVLAALTSCCPLLEVLDISYSMAITHNGVELLGSLSKLNTLEMGGCTGVLNFNLELPALTDLNLHGLSAICDSTVSRLLRGASNISSLQLGESQITADISVAAMLPHSATLHTLDLSWCEGIESSDALAELVITAPLLENLSLQCVQLDAAVPMAIGECCHQLVTLNLSRTGCTAEAVHAIAKGCTLLEELNLSWSNICDAGLLALVKHCKALRMLELQGCKGLTEEVGVFLPLNCPPHLEEVRRPYAMWCTAEGLCVIGSWIYRGWIAALRKSWKCCCKTVN